MPDYYISSILNIDAARGVSYGAAHEVVVGGSFVISFWQNNRSFWFTFFVPQQFAITVEVDDTIFPRKSIIRFSTTEGRCVKIPYSINKFRH